MQAPAIEGSRLLLRYKSTDTYSVLRMPQGPGGPIVSFFVQMYGGALSHAWI